MRSSRFAQLATRKGCAEAVEFQEIYRSALKILEISWEFKSGHNSNFVLTKKSVTNLPVLNLEDWRRTPQPQWLQFIQPFVFSIVWKKHSNDCNLDGKRVLGEILQFVYWNHTLNNLLSLPVPADSLVGSNLKSNLTQGFKTTGLEGTLACSLIQPVPELAKPKAKFDPECRFQVRSQKVPKAKSLSGGLGYRLMAP